MTAGLDMIVDELMRRWTRIGGRFNVRPAQARVVPEGLLADTALYAEHNERLFFVAATWLGTHTELVNSRRLGQRFRELTGKASAVAGAICEIAKRIEGAPEGRLNAAAGHCIPLEEPALLFLVAERFPALAAESRERTLPEFGCWGLLHHEISLKRGAVRPARWLRVHCPELRMRELLGGTLEADILHLAMEAPRTAYELGQALDASYSATHQASTHLARRGLLEQLPHDGPGQPYAVPKDVHAWLRFPPTH